jgi:hypothetical protein
MCGSATFMCQAEATAALCTRLGPVGVIRDPKNLQIPPPPGKAITTEALQVRSWLAERCMADTFHACAEDLNHALGRLGPSTLVRASRTV